MVDRFHDLSLSVGKYYTLSEHLVQIDIMDKMCDAG